MELLGKIKGDYEGFVVWVEENYPVSLEVEDGVRILTFSDGRQSGFDSRGRKVLDKVSDGDFWEKTFDSNGIQLTHKDSGGGFWEKTFDSKGNQTSFKDSHGMGWKKEFIYSDAGQLIRITENGEVILEIPEF